MEDKRKIELLNEWFESEISTKENDVFNCDYSCYEECTADGYEVFVLKSDKSGPVSVNEEVYYYDHSLHEAILEVYEYRRTTIYVDYYLYEHLDLESHLIGLFEEYVEEIVDNDDSLTTEEVNELKEEYGIEERTESA